MENDYEKIQSFLLKNSNNNKIMNLKLKFEYILKNHAGNKEQRTNLFQNLIKIINKYEISHENKSFAKNHEKIEKDYIQNHEKFKILKANLKQKQEIYKKNMEKIEMFKKQTQNNIFDNNQKDIKKSIEIFKKSINKLCLYEKKQIMIQLLNSLDEMNMNPLLKRNFIDFDINPLINEYTLKENEDFNGLKHIIMNSEYIFNKNEGNYENLPNHILKFLIFLSENQNNEISQLKVNYQHEISQINSNENEKNLMNIPKIHEIKKKYLQEQLINKGIYQEIEILSQEEKHVLKNIKKILKIKEPEIAEKLQKLLEDQIKFLKKNTIFSILKAKTLELRKKIGFEGAIMKISKEANDLIKDEKNLNFKQKFEKNFEILCFINEKKIENNDFIYQNFFKKIKEITDKNKNFSISIDNLLDISSSLTFEKIQDCSMALINIVPNKFLHQVKQEINEDFVNFGKKITKYKNYINENKEILMNFTKTFMINFKDFFINLGDNIEVYWKKFKILILKITKFFEKVEKLSIDMSSIKGKYDTYMKKKCTISKK